MSGFEPNRAPFEMFSKMLAQYFAGRAAEVSPIDRYVGTAANTAARLVLQADAGKRVYGHLIQVTVRGAAVVGDQVIKLIETDRQDETAGVAVTDQDRVRWVGVFGAAAPVGSTIGIVDDLGIKCSPGRSLALVVPALGAGVIAEILLTGWQMPERTGNT